MAPTPRPSPHPWGYSLAENLGTLYVGIGFLISWGVAIALIFPLDPLARFLPPAFVPTFDALLSSGDWRSFMPHYLYSLYGVLLMSLGALLRNRVARERDRWRVIGVF